MTRDHDPEFQDWLTDARQAPFEDAIALNGFRPKKGFENKADRSGPCPACGGDDRFSVHMKDRVFNCRGCGIKGADALSLAMVGQKNDAFLIVVEQLAGRPRPGRRTSEPRPVDHDRQSAMRDAERDKLALASAKDRQQRARKAHWAEDVWNNAQTFSRSRGEAYWRLRGLDPLPGADEYLGFLPEFPVREGGVEIGRWPCIVAPMRDRAMGVIGLHCTFLDHKEPIKAELWATSEKGERYRVPAKRMYGTLGIVWLSPVKPELVIAEGVETARGWLQCGYGSIADPALASACSLGGLTGGAMGTRPHPEMKGTVIPDGVPDPAKRGFLDHLPAEVREVTVLGDCDIPHHNGLAHYQTMARRLVALGMGGGVHFPLSFPWSKKYDWADLAKDEAESRGRGEAA